MNRFVGPELLGDHQDIETFDGGDEALDNWLYQRPRRNQLESASRTWVVSRDDSVVGYYASSTAVVLRSQATKHAARNQPDPLPALLLARLAVDQSRQGHGLGAALLKHFLVKSIEVANVIGVRVLLVHAKDPQVGTFYRKYGFEPHPSTTSH